MLTPVAVFASAAGGEAVATAPWLPLHYVCDGVIEAELSCSIGVPAFVPPAVRRTRAHVLTFELTVVSILLKLRHAHILVLQRLDQ